MITGRDAINMCLNKLFRKKRCKNSEILERVKFFLCFSYNSYLCSLKSIEIIMKQRVQSILFFLSAVFFGLLFFMPLASYLDEYGTYFKLYVYGVNALSLAPNTELPFSSLYTLPLLVLTVAVILINFYLSMSIFRAVKLQQFIRLWKLSRINIALAVVLIATVFVFYLVKTGAKVAMLPSFQWPAWGAFLTLVALIMMLVASSGLKKDIDKVRSVDRLR